MVRLRLRKVGSKGQQSFRIVAAESEHPRDGRFLEIIGNYNPRTNPGTINVDEARAFHWMSNGAQPSESVGKLFRITGTADRFARLKAGEPQETLLAEAEAAKAARGANQKTSDISTTTRLSKKRRAAEQAEKAA